MISGEQDESVGDQPVVEVVTFRPLVNAIPTLNWRS